MDEDTVRHGRHMLFVPIEAFVKECELEIFRK